MDSTTVRQHIQRAIGLVNACIEGGIDPFISPAHVATVQYLIDAQAALEQAEEAWGNV